MAKTAVVVVAGAGAVLLWRRLRRHGAAPPAAHPLDPLAIVASDDPDDVVNLLRTGWAHVVDDAAGLAALPHDTKADQVATRHAAAAVITAAVRLDAAEEAVVWPVLRAEVDGGDALADEADRRGVELRRSLHAADELHPSDPTWEAGMAAAAAALRERDVWARTHLWPPFSRAVDAPRRVELGHAFEAARASAPTRPHLATPGAHPAADRLRAALDRTVDSLTARS